jgi:hypothetical protein
MCTKSPLSDKLLEGFAHFLKDHCEAQNH